MNRYLLILCLLLSACSNLPPAIEDAPLYDLSYVEAAQNMAKYKNAPVRWGGMIVEVENEQNFSVLQVLYYPLNSYGRPQTSQDNVGRFLIKSAQFLDPAIYAKNSLVTVAGTLNGMSERTIGKKVMQLPEVASNTLYLWPVYEPVSTYGGFGYSGFGYYGGDPYSRFYGYPPFYWGGFYRPYPYRYCR